MPAPSGNDLLPFALKKGNKKVQIAARAASQVWDELRHDELNGEVPVVNFAAPWAQSAKWLVDGGARSVGTSVSLIQGQASQKIVDAPLKLNLAALKTLRGVNAANYLKINMDGAGMSIGQAIESGSLLPAGLLVTASKQNTATPSVTNAAGINLTVPSPAGLSAGMAVTVLNAAKTGCQTFRISDITFAATATSLGATVQLIPDVVGVTALTDGQLQALYPFGDASFEVYMRGSVGTAVGITVETQASGGDALVSNSNSVTSLDSIASPTTASLYGTTLAQRQSVGQTGQAFASVGDASEEALTIRAQRVFQRSGKLPSTMFVGPMTFSVVKMSGGSLGFLESIRGTAGSAALQVVGQARLDMSGKKSKYTSSVLEDDGAEVAGRKLIKCQALPDDIAFMSNVESEYFAIWQDIEAELFAGSPDIPDINSYTRNFMYNAILEHVDENPAQTAKLSGIRVGI